MIGLVIAQVASTLRSRAPEREDSIGWGFRAPGHVQEGDMESYFVLDERGEPQPEHDLEAWTRWLEHADRSIARTAVKPDVTILTTFRGVHETSERCDPPRLFETRVFGGLLDGEEVEQCTRAEAIAAHVALAEWCRIGNAPNAGVNEELVA